MNVRRSSLKDDHSLAGRSCLKVYKKVGIADSGISISFGNLVIPATIFIALFKFASSLPSIENKCSALIVLTKLSIDAKESKIEQVIFKRYFIFII